MCYQLTGRSWYGSLNPDMSPVSSSRSVCSSENPKGGGGEMMEEEEEEEKVREKVIVQQ